MGGEVPAMNYALVVIGNGRLSYLEKVIDSAFNYLPTPNHLLMVDDSGNREVANELHRNYPDFTTRSHVHNQGMAAAVQSGFNLVKETDAEYIFWLEEDMELIATPPLEDAVKVLVSHPHLAQMCFRREPWWGSPVEMQLGDQLAAIASQARTSVAVVNRSEIWTEHDYIFSLNPCLIPRVIIDTYTWPSGPIGIGNETGMTNQLLDDKWLFGSWGVPGDGQVWARHLGEERGKQWQL